MRSRSAAALALVAAICGSLVVPALASAQLRCPEDGSAPQIRTVRFEGNNSFTGSELQLHVYATPTDLSSRYTSWLVGRKPIVYGAVVGTAIGALARKDNHLSGAALGAAVGAGTVAILGSKSGVKRCLLPGLLVGDMSSIRGFYGDRGFPDTRVDTMTKVEGKLVDITFRIVEGAPVLIDSVFIPLDSMLADLGPRLNSRKGERYSPALLQQDIDSIETRLQDSGYPEAKALRDSVAVDRHRATILLNIDRGPRARIGRVSILPAGVEGRPALVDTQSIRELLLFEPGALYSERLLFESERRFYRVGSFLTADVSADVSHVYQDSLVDVNVRLVEDLGRRFGYEVGLGTLDCLRAKVDYSNRAFQRGLNRVDLSASVSKVGRANGGWDGFRNVCSLNQEAEPDISSREINYNGTIRYTRPSPLRGGLMPSLSAYRERRGGYQAYLRTTLAGGALSLSKYVTRTIFAEATYSLEYGETKASEPVLCFIFQACDQPTREQLTGGNTRLAVAGVRFSRDRRNFADSASRGTFARLDFRFSEPFIGSDPSLNFEKATVDVGWYKSLFGGTVLAARARGGVILGGQLAAGGGRLPPPQERLYTGGETTVRGFRQNELGPLTYVTDSDLDSAFIASRTPQQLQDTLQRLRMRTIPTGGAAMVTGNLELRIPGPFLRTLETVLFVDVGALSTEGFATIGEKQARWTPGLGFKYFSPIGPVQFNFGYNRYESVAGPVYLNTGPGAEDATLKCLSGTKTETVGGVPTQVCQPIKAKADRKTFLSRITFTIAFPPDF